MGIPYSKQINAAFDQVTPLVAAGFQVLETTKNIAILLTFIEIFTVILLSLILIALLMLLVTMNPELEEERRTFITPVIKWVFRVVQQRVEYLNKNWLMISVGMTFLIAGIVFLSSPFLLRKFNIKMVTMKGDEEVEASEGENALDEPADNGKEMAPNSNN
jgi:hypothetical protein